MQHKSRDFVMVVLEDGGEWPRWLPVLEDAAHESRVVRQDEGETFADLAARVRVALDRLARDGHPVDLSVVACSERADAAALAGRRAIAQHALSWMARGGRGSLLFTESLRQSGPARHALSALAADLESEWEDLGLHVSVRFGEPSRPPQESVSDSDSP